MTKTLQERFEERFPNFRASTDDYQGTFVVSDDEMLSFVQSELDLQRKGIVERIKDLTRLADKDTKRIINQVIIIIETKEL